jgi:hypothetical protein
LESIFLNEAVFPLELCEIQLLQGEAERRKFSYVDFLLKLSPFHSPFVSETLSCALPEAIKST